MPDHTISRALIRYTLRISPAGWPLLSIPARLVGALENLKHDIDVAELDPWP